METGRFQGLSEVLLGGFLATLRRPACRDSCRVATKRADI